MYQIIPSEVGFTASQGTGPYSYKAFHSETLQAFAQRTRKKYSLYWLYFGRDFSFCLCCCGKEVKCRLVFTVLDASTVSHRGCHEDTATHPQTDTIYPQMLFFFKTN